MSTAPLRRFLSNAQTARHARTYAREAVEAAVPGISEDSLADVQLIVSELVTNAYRYGTEPGDRVGVSVDAQPAGARVEVHDPARRRPRPKALGQESERGRGLHVVREIADRWGIDDRPFGKAVWAELTWH
ncbi:ATP-binding protein [Streptomyces paromomycinus]|uniref:ATP-binding protein n=1 Tax=Streptomyces paromomycinus TaxID=92743 RepID=UPI001FEA170A|nr:ATP-binding protein [Streptomyces paromomycinus]